MQKKTDINLLKKSARLLFGVKLGRDEKDLFAYYLQQLIDWNERLNLFPPGSRNHLATNMFLDSLSIMKYLPFTEGMKIIDIGSGNGCPGLPLKFAFRGMELLLVESNHKRTLFLNKIVQDLDEAGIGGIRVLNLRAEEISTETRCDMIVTRGTYRLDKLLPVSRKLLHHKGYLVYYAGEDGADQAKQAKSQIMAHHFQLVKVFDYLLPNMDYHRNLIILKFLGDDNQS
ncbi:MAG: 16S rRNA (guanine(527)-N(7))-methyltransferase RsmG [Candidatus Delongbacteria bacterium]|nr:16S rRNA (guanine(527)-N(7))-methyltransferase RsmG [Candidatus Delongbacteria bacterium]